jgi:hypothetical protein
LARAEAAVLFRREVIVGELQLERDVRSEKHTSVEFPGAVGAGRAVRLPALLRRALDLLALTRSAADKQHGDGKHGAQGANSIGCMSLG